MSLLSLFFYSVWHVFLPGESTPLLLALALTGVRRRALMRTAVGLAVSNGAVMVILLLLGVLVARALDVYMNTASLCVRVAGSALFIALGMYFFVQARRRTPIDRVGDVTGRQMLVEKHPLATGFIIGAVPTPRGCRFLHE